MSDICRNCGEVLKEGAKFCGSCGAKVEPIVEDPVVEAPVEETPVMETPVVEAPVESITEPEQPAGHEAPQPVYPTPDQPNFTVPEMPDRRPDEPPHGAYGQFAYGAPAQNASYSPNPQPTPPTGGYQPQQQYVPNGQPQQYVPNGQPQQYVSNGQPTQPRYYAPTQPGPYGQPPYGAHGYGVQPQPQKKSKTGLIIGIVIGAVVIIAGVGILLWSILGNGKAPSGSTDKPAGENSSAVETSGANSTVQGNGYATPDDAVAAYIKGIEGLVKGEGDFAAIMNSCYEYQYVKSEYKSTIQDAIDEQNGTMEDTFALLRSYADDFSVTYKIKDTKTMTASEQEAFIEDHMIDDYCDTSAIGEICTCDVTMTMNFYGTGSDSDMKLTCIKADGQWFLSFNGMDA